MPVTPEYARAYIAFERAIANTIRSLNLTIPPSLNRMPWLAEQAARQRSGVKLATEALIVALTPADIANLLDLERQVLEQLKTLNKVKPPELNPIPWIALETSRLRVQALNILNGTDTTAPIISPPSISPRTGSAGTQFTGTPGIISSGSLVRNRWLLDGSPLGTANPIVVDSGGVLTFVTEALGPTGYPGSASSIGVNVTAPADGRFSMAQLPARNRVYQRTSSNGGVMNKGQATVGVTVTMNTSMALWVRIRDDTGAIIVPAFQTATLPTGQQVVNITVDARLSWLYIDMSADNVVWQRGSTPFAVGRVVAGSGQSLMVRKFANMTDTTNTLTSMGIRPNQYGVVYATYEDAKTCLSPAWQVPAVGGLYDSAHAALFLQSQIGLFGVPCAFVGHAHGNKWIGWFKPGAEDNAKLRTVLSAVGGFECFIWDHGHSDSSAYGPDYMNNLDAVMGDVTAYNAVRGSNYQIIVDTIPTITNGFGPPASINNLRNTMKTWAANKGAQFQCALDLDTTDGIHPSQTGGIATARHDHRATRVSLGLNGDQGPVMATGYRSSNTNQIFIFPTLAQGAKLVGVGNPAVRFKVAQRGSTDFIPLSGVIVGDNSIVITLGTFPADSVALDVYWGYPYDSSLRGSADMIYDNVVDGDGLTIGRQLQPNFTPLMIQAPANASTQ